MIFDALDKIKRNAIFTAILLIALGIVVMIAPQSYAPTLLLGFGFTLTVVAIVMALNFFVSKKSLMDYVKFVGAVALGIAGICVLVFRDQTVLVMAVAFGILLIIDGLRTLIHSFTFARRSGRRAWWVLSIVSAVLIGIGVMLAINPFTSNQNTLMLAIGLALLFAGSVSIFRLYWTWPVKKKQEQPKPAPAEGPAPKALPEAEPEPEPEPESEPALEEGEEPKNEPESEPEEKSEPEEEKKEVNDNGEEE